MTCLGGKNEHQMNSIQNETLRKCGESENFPSAWCMAPKQRTLGWEEVWKEEN